MRLSILPPVLRPTSQLLHGQQSLRPKQDNQARQRKSEMVTQPEFEVTENYLKYC